MQPSPASPAQVHFSTDVRNMDNWAARTGIPLTTAEALGTPYARAHKWLHALKNELIQRHGWQEVSSPDPRMLFIIEAPTFWRSPAGLPLGPKQTLQLPVHASSFFSADRRVQWEMVFHSDIFATQRLLLRPIADILNLLQCILTGLVTLVHEEHLAGAVYTTTRGLPSAQWIIENQIALIDIFHPYPGHYQKLLKACSTPNASFNATVRSP